MSETITTPVGRLVQGSLYRGNDKDADGKPLVYKSGKKIGQQRIDFYFAVAIKKENETHWNQTEWGQVIESVGKADFPKGQWMRPDFSWKVTDGDSTILNKANPPRRPCDMDGFAGNWILRFSRPLAPKIYNSDGSQQIFEENYINLGDYVQVLAFIAGNESDQQPGVYLNHLMVAFSGYGDRITLGPDPKSVGFGKSPLPAGVSSTPIAAFVPPVEAPEAIISAPVVSPPPYPQILVASPPPPARIMLPSANGLTYDQYKSAGWTDDQLIQNGLMSA